MELGVMVIAAYRPLPGKGAALMELTREHVPILRRLGFATARPALAMRAADGTVVEVFEWQSKAAIARAHENPEVLAMWQRYEACCAYTKLVDLAESSAMFASFEPLDL